MFWTHIFCFIKIPGDDRSPSEISDLLSKPDSFETSDAVIDSPQVDDPSSDPRDDPFSLSWRYKVLLILGPMKIQGLIYK